MELALLAPDPMTPPLPISPTFPLFPLLPLPIGPPPMLPPTFPPNDDPPKLEGPAVDAVVVEDAAELAMGMPLPTTPSELPNARPRPPSDGNSDGSNVCSTPFSVGRSFFF